MKSPWASVFDLHAGDGRVEVPVERAQRLELAEVGVLDERSMRRWRRGPA